MVSTALQANYTCYASATANGHPKIQGGKIAPDLISRHNQSNPNVEVSESHLAPSKYPYHGCHARELLASGILIFRCPLRELLTLKSQTLTIGLLIQ